MQQMSEQHFPEITHIQLFPETAGVWFFLQVFAFLSPSIHNQSGVIWNDHDFLIFASIQAT